jgi:UDP-4-amino-4-deoxy-L-arabinose formyltransferase/UDP-glucuronic acid dehydrogenase (UDP-4-keto-hexauronic acid decarboxylating)
VRALVLAYHDVGCAGIEALLDAGVEVAGVYTHDDDPAEGRWFRSVADVARSARIGRVSCADVHAPPEVAAIRALAPDIVFSFYYRRIVAPEILAIPRLGAMNLHGSYLPRYRGRSPVNWVLVHGETSTGVTLHYMNEKPDAGDIVAQRAIPIGFHDTALDLHRRVVREARQLLDDTLPAIRRGANERRPQDLSRGSYFGARRPEDGRIDWGRRATEIHNLVRAVARPWPGAFTELRGRRLHVWRARPEPSRDPGVPGRVRIEGGRLAVETGDGLLEVLRGQAADGAECDGADLVRLGLVRDGDRLG